MASTHLILVLGGSCDSTAKKTVKRHLPSNVGDLVLFLFCGFFVVEFSPFLFIRLSNSTHEVWDTLKWLVAAHTTWIISKPGLGLNCIRPH